MKDFLLSTAMRAIPAIAGSLVTYGVSLEHSEPIAIGIVLAGVTVVDLVIKALQPKLPKWKP